MACSSCDKFAVRVASRACTPSGTYGLPIVKSTVWLLGQARGLQVSLPAALKICNGSAGDRADNKFSGIISEVSAP